MAISLVQKKTKTNSLERSKDCRLLFFSSAAASATAPSAPTEFSDGGSGSQATHELNKLHKLQPS
jgi:hypothetical protein